MYTEEYEKRGFPLLSFLFKIIFIIALLLLFLFLLFKFFFPALKKEKSSTNSTLEETTINNRYETFDAEDYQYMIFTRDMESMKEAAVSYYTEARLPVVVGDSRKMTLEEMASKRIISLLGEYDATGSYVEVTKQRSEYLLRVQLKNQQRDDYIFIHLGDYDYCRTLS